MPPFAVPSAPEFADKFPLPVQAKNIKLLLFPSLPKTVVLEVNTKSNPVRVFLNKKQLQWLAERAGKIAHKIQG